MRYFKHSRHCEKIISLVERPSESENLPVATDVLKSWQRSLKQHGIDPSRPNQVRILTARELREYSQPIEAFLSIARAGIDNLYRHVCDLGYSTLLCDAQGITVDWRGEDRFKKEWKQAGLYLGAVWTECHEGTCSVGTGLIEQRPLTIHHGEHFRALNAELTCSSAPIFDPSGQLLAVLDVSALRSPESKDSQHLTLQLVIETAHLIETAYFCNRFPEHYILKLNHCRELAEVHSDFLLALDGQGRILAATRKTLEALTALAGGRIIGRDIGELFDMNFERVQSSAGLVFPLRTHRGEGFYASLRAPQALQFPPAARDGKIERSRRPSPAPRDGSLTLDYLAGADATLRASVERMKRVLDKNISIMLFGETGTGKEVFARAIHNASRRADKPFVAVNCAAIPESLIESELFGYTDGAFTGARSKGMRGKLLQADGGTLFLDEIGDMPASLQPRLLRVLAEKEVIPLGGDRAIPVDIQVICATHRNIRCLVESGGFREDLFYRLNGIAFELPPLRKRSDLTRLIQSALALEAEAETASVGIDEEAMALLTGFDWPGNIRQLRNALRYALAVCDGQSIGIHDLPEEIAAGLHRQAMPRTLTAPAPRIATPAGPELPAPADDLNHLELAEREAIVQALIQHKWQVSKAARSVGISRATIYRKMDRYCITAPNKI